MKLQSPKAWWSGLSERKQAGYLFCLKLAVLVLTLMVGISIGSYLSTWKADQSLLTAEKGAEVANSAASGGFSLGHFLVTQSFGLRNFVEKQLPPLAQPVVVNKDWRELLNK